jgi:virginiamycin A acetyltransferase
MRISYLSNFFRNTVSLVKCLCTKPNLYFGSSVQQIANSKIDASVVISKPHAVYNVTIGFATAIGPNSQVSYTSVGKFCSIGPNFLCGWGIHPIDTLSISPVFYSVRMQNGFTYSKTDKIEERKVITIGNDVFIGANVTVLDGITIGDGAVIGAGAVVSKNIPPYAIAVGCPIRVIKYRFEPEVIENLLQFQWWNKDENTWRMMEKYLFNVEAFLELMQHRLAVAS